MSYYISVWDGSKPLSNAHAASEFRRRRGRGHNELPGPAVERLLSSLLADGTVLDLPAESPAQLAESLASCVDGATVILPVLEHNWHQSIGTLLHQAERYDLVVFDPDRAELLPSALDVERRVALEMPPPEHLPIHLKALLDEAIEAPHPMMGVLEDDVTGFYVQWVANSGTLVVEAQGEKVVLPQLKLARKEKNSMIELGFAEEDPNWSSTWLPQILDTAAAAEALAAVLVDVRRFDVGRPLTLNTFPQVAAVAE